MRLLYILVGGAIGSVLRYWISGIAQKIFAASFPSGTVAVNCIGSFAFGFLAEITSETMFVTPEARAFIFIGLLGAFTTFSTFSWELYELIREASYYKALFYFLSNVLGSFALVFAGVVVARMVLSR